MGQFQFQRFRVPNYRRQIVANCSKTDKVLVLILIWTYFFIIAESATKYFIEFSFFLPNHSVCTKGCSWGCLADLTHYFIWKGLRAVYCERCSPLTTIEYILYFRYFITALKKGQALSGYYRVLLKDGGWIWMQTKANVVYQTSTGQPQFISCIHYVIRYIYFMVFTSL